MESMDQAIMLVLRHLAKAGVIAINEEDDLLAEIGWALNEVLDSSEWS